MSESDQTNERSEKEIFGETIEKGTPEERAAYLDGACGKDVSLRRRVEDLLAKHFQQDSFMKKPAVEGSPTVVLPISEGPGAVIGRYKLLEKLGEGGFGAVYVAEQKEPVKRRVALKIIKLGMDTKQVIASFEAERQALALMDHPNIAKVFDTGTTETGRPYFVMELVRGVSITSYCDENNLGMIERLELFNRVCAAIQHAHQKGIIHRDIKPSNVLVTLHDGVPVPKVIDFGIAKAMHGELTDKTIYTQFQQFIGTPAYISPEQAEMSGLDMDTRSDIYSLGVLLYELLVGRTPFDGKELVMSGLDEMRRVIREKEPLRPSTRLTAYTPAELTATAKRRSAEPPKLVHALRGDLDWIVMKCLEKDRARRYDAANGLASDIQRYLDNETVLARPPSAAYRFQKLVRRNKLAFAAVGAVAGALVLGVVVSTWQAVRATSAERAQKAQAEQARADRDRALRAEADSRIQTGVANGAWATARRKAYAAEVNVAFQALAENNLVRAIDLLNRQRPKPGEEDLRGFEWRLLWKQCQADQKVTFRDEGAGGEVLFSPDGKWLVNGGDEIVIRELPSLARVASIPNTIPSGARTFAFSPRARLLAVSQDTDVRLWNTESWKEERALPGTRYPAVFSPDGRWLITGAPASEPGARGGYRLWNTETWQAERFFGSELERIWVARRAVTFSPDGTILVTAGHPDGRGSGNEFQVWDFPSLTVRSNFARFPGRVCSAAFAPDGKHLLTGTAEGGLLVWNVAEGRIVESLKEHASWITTIAVAGDGRTFATASTDRTLVLWDAATRKALVRLRGHLAQIWSTALSPDGRMLASSALDGTTRLWDATTRHKQRELPGCFVVAGFSSDSRRLVGVGYGESRLWNLENGAITTIPFQDYKKLQYRGVDYRFMWASRDLHGIEPKAVYGRTDGLLEVWNLATMSRVTSWRVDDGDVATTTFSPDGKIIASSGAGGEVVLWDAGTHREVRRFETLGGKMMGLTFSPDGRLLAGSEAKDDDCHVGVWDVKTGALMRKLPFQWQLVLSLAFSPDGKLLATADQNERVQLWDIPSGALRVTLMGHAQTAISVAFSPDGKTLATGGSDSKVKLWNLVTEQEVATLELPGGCTSVKFSPDGRTLAVGYLLEPEQHIRLWEVPSFKDIAAAETKEKAEIKQL